MGESRLITVSEGMRTATTQLEASWPNNLA
jgi:hypothetical protein